MTALTPFQFHGNDVRTIVGADGEPRFVLADVCRVLGLTSPHKVADRIPEDARSLAPVIDSMGRTQQATLITEAGLYRVVMRSDSPQAEPFITWVTSCTSDLIERAKRETEHGATAA